MTHPLIGKPAPIVTLPDHNGELVTLNEGGAGTGVPIALFFYPKSGSYGCTREACSFRDAIEAPGQDVFKPGKVQVVGVSGDPVSKQKAFVEKQGLNYTILSDTKGEARKEYNVGRGLLGLVDARITFVIDEHGIVRDVLDSTLNFNAHVKFVSGCLEKLAKQRESVADSENK